MNDDPYFVLGLMVLVAIGFALGPLILAGIWAAKFKLRQPGQEKDATYECGLVSRGDAWIQFRSEYYLYGILFLVFDVEAVFLFPFAVAFTDLSAGAVAAMLVFMLLLVEGLVWAWTKGVLNWK